MRSRQLEAALTDFLTGAAAYLRAEVADGREVPFELVSKAGRRGQGSTPLYCYRALTGAFIADRDGAIRGLPGHGEAVKLLESFDGLDRYLATISAEPGPATGRARGRAAIRALLEDVFDEQTDFELRPERVRAALDRLEQSEFISSNEVTVVATLHGLAIASSELQLTKGLTIAQRDALRGLPDAALAVAEDAAAAENHLIVVHTLEDENTRKAVARAREVLDELLRALRLFGDGRVSFGALAWARVGSAAWSPLPLGRGGRPNGTLVVTVEQEDELRAFCSLVSRRAPQHNELAWALRRFELGCERQSSGEALTDHLLALRALLEPEGPGSGMLAARLAALCATPEHRAELAERIVQTVALERDTIMGVAATNAAAEGLKLSLGGHLRALLTDVICGHLSADLAALADELLEASALAPDDTSERAGHYEDLTDDGLATDDELEAREQSATGAAPTAGGELETVGAPDDGDDAAIGDEPTAVEKPPKSRRRKTKSRTAPVALPTS